MYEQFKCDNSLARWYGHFDLLVSQVASESQRKHADYPHMVVNLDHKLCAHYEHWIDRSLFELFRIGSHCMVRVVRFRHICGCFSPAIKPLICVAEGTQLTSNEVTCLLQLRFPCGLHVHRVLVLYWYRRVQSFLWDTTTYWSMSRTFCTQSARVFLLGNQSTLPPKAHVKRKNTHSA